MRYKTIGRDKFGGKVWIVQYKDGGTTYHDLHTDGRVLLTPALALKLAKKLTEFANPFTKPMLQCGHWPAERCDCEEAKP